MDGWLSCCVFRSNISEFRRGSRPKVSRLFSVNEGLPGVWGNKGTWPISRGTENKNLREHGNHETVLRITGTNIVNIVKGI